MKRTFSLYLAVTSVLLSALSIFGFKDVSTEPFLADRSIIALDVSVLLRFAEAAIVTALNSFSASECANYFTNSGYEPD